MPSAMTELLGSINFRRQADMSRAVEARIGVVQPIVGFAGSKLRIQYLQTWMDPTVAANWRYLSKKSVAGNTDTGTDWTEPALADTTAIEIAVGTGTGLKVGLWGLIYPDALTDVLLRVVGEGGNAVVSPSFTAIWMEFR